MTILGRQQTVRSSKNELLLCLCFSSVIVETQSSFFLPTSSFSPGLTNVFIPLFQCLGVDIFCVDSNEHYNIYWIFIYFGS